MGILKWVLRIVALLLAVFVIGGFLLPSETTVQRSIDIDAPAADIYPHIVDLEANQAWTPWFDRDPDMELVWGDVTSGLGAQMSWASDQKDVGAGSMEITKAEAPGHVTTALDFGPMGTATAWFDLVEADAKTNVTWGFVSHNGNNLLFRWTGLMLDGWVGPDYQLGLENLKALVEG